MPEPYYIGKKESKLPGPGVALLRIARDVGRQLRKRVDLKKLKPATGISPEVESTLKDAVFATGGISKLMTIPKMMKKSGIIDKIQAHYHNKLTGHRGSHLLDLTTIPQKEFHRIRKIDFSNKPSGGTFLHNDNAILLNPHTELRHVLPHEFVHSRQQFEAWKGPHTIEKEMEATRRALIDTAHRVGVPKKEWYKLDPTEHHAYEFERRIRKIPFKDRLKMFDKVYNESIPRDPLGGYAILLDDFLGYHGEKAQKAATKLLKSGRLMGHSDK